MRRLTVLLIGSGMVLCGWAALPHQGQAAALAAASGTAEEEETGAWLGVVMSPLPEPLADHLGLDDQGIMIINVAKDSPADQAGLQQYDVIVGLDGESLSSDFGEFARKIRSYRPGEQVKLRIIRDGEPVMVKLALGDRPEDEPEVGYLYAVRPKNVIRQQLKGHGQIIRQDDQGNWVIEDLGEIQDWPSLMFRHWPGWKHLPYSFMGVSGDKTEELTIRVTEDGETTEITRKGGKDQPIVVRRTREDEGDEEIEEKSYRDEDQLREEDPEAYELFKGTRGGGHGWRYKVVVPGLEDLSKRQKEWAWEIQRSIEENEGAWREALEEAMEAARKAQEEAMDHYHDALKLQEDIFEQAPLLKEWKGKWMGPGAIDDRSGTTITVQPGGEIHIITKQGDTTLKRIFRDADELREQDERLYAKYERLLEEEGEE